MILELKNYSMQLLKGYMKLNLQRRINSKNKNKIYIDVKFELIIFTFFMYFIDHVLNYDYFLFVFVFRFYKYYTDFNSFDIYLI
jgi:hypothetical protein